MQKLTARLSLAVLAFLVCGSFAVHAQSSPHALRKSELLAMVSGGSLVENIVAEMQIRGLGFTPDEHLKQLLETAGADPRVLAALKTAKTAPGKQSSPAENSAALEHLSNAGKMIKAGQIQDAMDDLNAVLAGGTEKSEADFVMGMILADQGRYEEAGQIYAEIEKNDSGFPQVHTRLSMTNYNTGHSANALREAKAALLQNPNDPSAHLNAGISYEQMGKLDSAKQELQAAIRSKPDYAMAYYDLGNILRDAHDLAGALAQYRKALAINPDDLNARFNLGSALVETDPAAAIVEWRKITAMAPDWPICHQCLASALSQTGRLDEAIAEFRTAASLDPSLSGPHLGLGRVFESQKKYLEALAEYRAAQKLDDSSAEAFDDAGRILALKKEYPAAIAEFRRAKELDPTNCGAINSLGEALEASGNHDAAVPEYREALLNCPKEIKPRLNLAAALEKKGDWAAALQNYHQAALDEPPPKINFAQRVYYAQQNYESAQKRFQQHLSDLRATGKSSEAAALEASLKTQSDSAGLDEKYHDTIQACMKALGEQRFDEAETLAKQAIEIAEKILPQDGRLPEAVGSLGVVYGRRMDFAKANEAFKRQLALSEKLYGSQSPIILTAVKNLAMLSGQRKDFPAAEKYLQQALELNQKFYGLESSAYAENLLGLGQLYMMEQDYAKSEATILRVLQIYEKTYAEDGVEMNIPLTALCYDYDQWGKPDKSAPCHARIIAIVEKQFGASSPYLVQELSAEAKALRQLGRTEEALKLEQRTQTIQSALANPN